MGCFDYLFWLVIAAMVLAAVEMVCSAWKWRRATSRPLPPADLEEFLQEMREWRKEMTRPVVLHQPPENRHGPKL